MISHICMIGAVITGSILVIVQYIENLKTALETEDDETEDDETEDDGE